MVLPSVGGVVGYIVSTIMNFPQNPEVRPTSVPG